MDRLKREGNPPAGQLASPVPQAWSPTSGGYVEVTGSDLGPERFGTDVLIRGKTKDGAFPPVRVNKNGQFEFVPEVVIEDVIIEIGKEVKMDGNTMDLFGASIDDRPPASEVPVGATFTLVNENFDTWISDGVDWRLIE